MPLAAVGGTALRLQLDAALDLVQKGGLRVTPVLVRLLDEALESVEQLLGAESPAQAQRALRGVAAG